MGIGATALTLAALAALGWLAFLVLQSRVKPRREAPPQNLSPYMTDDELENRRLDRVLISALVSTAVLAVVLPIYYLNETSRQDSAEHRFEEIAVERGHEWWLEYQCGNCHGADAAGGGAPYVEARSGIPTTWQAPSLNDVFYRYTEEEVRYWLVYGRQGTPMPAWGTDGGGPLNSQQIDELLAYIHSIQITQTDVIAAVDGRVNLEITRLGGADTLIASAIAAQEEEIAALGEIPAQYEAIKDLPEELIGVLTGPDTCTDVSAAVVDDHCDGNSPDSDRDGISDAAELAINVLVARMVSAAPPSDPRTTLEAIAFDAANPFTTSSGITPVPDADQLDIVVTEFESIERDLRLTNEGLDGFIAQAEAGLAALQEAADARHYAYDVESLAEAFDGNVTQAQRAYALFNAYCARCHTSGYSAGVPFTQDAGSGAIGPSLRDGKALLQFPDIEDHYAFVLAGSENGKAYGVNGIGRGWMPGFGALLSEQDIMLIVKFERSLR